jgi:hypothetical protein
VCVYHVGNRNGEAYPAANLMPSVLGVIGAILDIELKGLTRYTENGRITNHRCNIQTSATRMKIAKTKKRKEIRLY